MDGNHSFHIRYCEEDTTNVGARGFNKHSVKKDPAARYALYSSQQGGDVLQSRDRLEAGEYFRTLHQTEHFVDDEEFTTINVDGDNDDVVPYPGAIRVRGIDARSDDDDVGTVVIGGYPQNSIYIVGQAELTTTSSTRRSSKNQQGSLSYPSTFHRDMDLIGLTVQEGLPHHATATYEGNYKWSIKTHRRVLYFCVGITTLMVGLLIAAVAQTMGAGAEESQQEPTRSSTTTTLKPTPMPSSPTTSPTLAPSASKEDPYTSHPWLLSAEIVGTVDTFGFNVDLNKKGTRVAIAAPGAHQGRGQVEVYERRRDGDSKAVEKSSSAATVFEEEWFRLGEEPILGDAIGDLASFGMDLTLEGNDLAVGYPGNGNGMVRVFESYDDGTTTRWTQKGQTISGPSQNSRFGAAVALNYDGTVLIVGAPLAGNEEQGMFQVYTWYGSRWHTHGAARYGENAGDRLGMSVGMNPRGDLVVVGVPYHDSPKNGDEDVGMVEIYEYVASSANIFSNDDCTRDCWIDITRGAIVGHESGSRFGQSTSSLFNTAKFVDFVASSSAQILNNDTSMAENSFSEDVRHVYVELGDGEYRIHEADPIRGYRSHRREGYDVDFDDDMFVLCSTTQNDNIQTGIIRCFEVLDPVVGGWYEFGPLSDTIHPLPLGNSTPWLSRLDEEEDGGSIVGPSVAVVADDKGMRFFATGYQSVEIHDGDSVPGVVRMYRRETD